MYFKELARLLLEEEKREYKRSKEKEKQVIERRRPELEYKVRSIPTYRPYVARFWMLIGQYNIPAMLNPLKLILFLNEWSIDTLDKIFKKCVCVYVYVDI